VDRYAATLILEVVLIALLSGVAMLVGGRILGVLGVGMCSPERVVVDEGLYHIVYRVGMRC